MEEKKREKLIMVMPVYNEEGCIEKVIKDWLMILRSTEQEVELVAVNDGSTDGTKAIMDRLGSEHKDLIVHTQINGGHGKALLTAMNIALERNPTWVFHCDSDDQFDAKDLFLLWKKRTESNFILGRRAKRHDALHRLVITRIMRLLVFLYFGCWIKDANVPFRLIKADMLKGMLGVLPSEAFAPNIFLSVLAKKMKQQTFDIPVTHRDRETGAVSIIKWNLLKVCFRTVKELFIFRATLGSRVKKLKKIVG